jgi:hypothetical protein
MLTRVLLAASLVIGGLAVAMPAEARGNGWARHHPARVQVNHRITRQQARITHQVRQSDLSRDEAKGLRGDLRAIRLQERAYAQGNDNKGRLTRAQVRDLNQQLNQTGADIRN